VRATPMLVVDAVEPSRQFFCERLGYEVVVEVPHGDAVGFSLLQRAGSDIMLQTRASIAADMAGLSSESFRSIVYIDVPNVAELSDALGDVEELVPLRTTFFGAVERFVREPGGNVIGLSSPAEQGA
jgi:hypothetical protein